MRLFKSASLNTYCVCLLADLTRTNVADARTHGGDMQQRLIGCLCLNRSMVGRTVTVDHFCETGHSEHGDRFTSIHQHSVTHTCTHTHTLLKTEREKNCRERERWPDWNKEWYGFCFLSWWQQTKSEAVWWPWWGDKDLSARPITLKWIRKISSLQTNQNKVNWVNGAAQSQKSYEPEWPWMYTYHKIYSDLLISDIPHPTTHTRYETLSCFLPPPPWSTSSPCSCYGYSL